MNWISISDIWKHTHTHLRAGKLLIFSMPKTMLSIHVIDEQESHALFSCLINTMYVLHFIGSFQSARFCLSCVLFANLMIGNSYTIRKIRCWLGFPLLSGWSSSRIINGDHQYQKYWHVIHTALTDVVIFSNVKFAGLVYILCRCEMCVLI